jgi:hypothetical protein
MDEHNTLILLNELSEKINNLYGFVEIAGENFGEPAINSKIMKLFTLK